MTLVISMGSVVGIKNDWLLIGRFRYLSYDFSNEESIQQIWSNLREIFTDRIRNSLKILYEVIEN